MAGSGEHDMDVSSIAFELLDRIVESRLRRRLLTVVDTLGLDDERRADLIALAEEVGLPAVLVVFDTPEVTVRARNRTRARPVPEKVLASQIRRFRQIRPRLDELSPLVVEADRASETPSLAATRDRAARPRTQSLRFYLQVSRFPWDDLARGVSGVAMAAEAAGFAGVAVMDHLFQIPQVGREWEPMPEAYVTLSYLAAISTALELGALVTGVTLRNPALLAKMVATLDVVSGGRSFCGLGAGWHQAEQVAYGYRFPPPAERVGALEDTLSILPLMWGPGKATYHGRFHSVEGAVCYPRPIQEKIPIIVGGRGERVIRLATRHAQGLNLSSPGVLDESLEAVRRGLAAAGRDSDEFEVSVLDTPIIGVDRTEVANLVEKHRGSRPYAEFAGRHHAGTPEAHIGRYRQLAARGVNAVFVAPVGLDAPESVDVWKEVTAAFAVDR